MIFIRFSLVIIGFSIASGFFHEEVDSKSPNENTAIAEGENLRAQASFDASGDELEYDDVTGKTAEKDSIHAAMTSLALNAECQEDLLDLIEKSFVTFQEDLENECVDQAELKKQLQQEREESNQRLLRFFFLVLMLFFISGSLSIYAIVESRRKSLSRSLSKKAVFRYKKSFVNESDATPSDQYQETDSTFQFDKTSFNSNTFKFRSSGDQSYTVAV